MAEGRDVRRALIGVGALLAAGVAAVVVPSVLDGDDTDDVQADGPAEASAGGAGWARLPDPPLSPRTGATAVWTGSEVVVLGGWEFLCPPGADCVVDPDIQPHTDGAAYDPVDDAWRPIAELPVGVTNTEGIAVDGDVYLLAASEPALLRYHPATDRWDVLPAPADDPSGYLLASGPTGLVAYRSSDEVEERPDLRFDPLGEAWVELPDDPLPPLYDRQLVADGDDLLLFGKEVDDPQSPSPVVGARLDGGSGAWEILPAAPGSGFQAWGVDGVVVLNPLFGAAMLGGIFDPAGATWSALPPFPVAESWRGDMAGVLGTSAATFEYAAGWVLDVAAQAWVEVPRIDGRPAFPSTGVVAAGRSLFVVGGEDWSGEDGRLLGDAWLWTPPVVAPDP